jgi:hypothetical protein
MNPEKRGSGSFHQLTRAINKNGAPCSRLKSHFKYDTAYRGIVSWAEEKAAMDPERFVWITNWTKFGKKRQVMYCLKFVEDRGLFISAKRFRRGEWRQGYIVADHSEVSEVLDGKLCRLIITDPSTAPVRKRGQRRNPSAAPCASETFSSASPDTAHKALPDDPGIEPSAFPPRPECISECITECICECICECI